MKTRPIIIVLCLGVVLTLIIAVRGYPAIAQASAQEAVTFHPAMREDSFGGENDAIQVTGEDGHQNTAASISTQQVKPYYLTSTVLLEDVSGSTIELLPANVAAANNSFYSFYILKEGGTYYLWLASEGGSQASNRSSIEQRFESQDGLVWRNRTNTNLVWNNTSYKYLAGLRQVIKNGSTYEAWEHYYYELSAGWGYAVRYITSNDGLTWTIANPPALIGAVNPSLVRDGNTYHMWVNPDHAQAGYTGSRSLRYRTSTSGGSDWGDWQAGGDLVKLDGSQEVSGSYAGLRSQTRVRQLSNGTYQLFYRDDTTINVATSTDGTNFTTQITDLLDLADILPDWNSFSDPILRDFAVIEVEGQDWFYFTYCDTSQVNWSLCEAGTSHIAVSQPEYLVHLPLILKPEPLTRLYVKSTNTGGIDPVEIRDPNDGDALLLSCVIGNNVTTYCGSFPSVGTYRIIAHTANCGVQQGIFYDATAGATITREVYCN